MEKAELIYRYIAPPQLSLNLSSVLCRLFAKLIFPLNAIVLAYAKMAPSCTAELLVKLLVPLKLNDALYATYIAPPLPLLTELLKKLLVSVKISATLTRASIAPP